MAGRAASSRGRQRHNTAENTARQMYVYGSAVPKPAYEPVHRERPGRKNKTSRQVRKNRRKAMHMSPGYVIFLTAAAILALVVCVNYVKLQSSITSRSKSITAMQEELADMKEENNTKYNAVMDSVNLNEIRDRAQGLGMVYASQNQIIEYENPAADYVKQYENIPEDGVLAKSNKAEK